MRVQDKKTSILLASVLKPVDEPRMCARIGQSLVKNGYAVFIAGFPPSSNKSVHGITFLPHPKFNRLSVSRIKARFSTLRKAFSVKPTIFIITTHELIGIAILYKLFTGKKIVYDVQENYWRNIRYTNAWPKFIRPLMAFLVQCKERIASPFFSKFFLAEKCYADELPFSRGRSIVIENKCAMPSEFQRNPSKEIMQLIFTGTIAESTGIFEAIDLTKKLHQLEPRVRLTIAGHCPQPLTLKMLEKEIKGSPFIQLTGGKDFVPHDEIMATIATANFGIISYPTSRHTENKIPSKLYEYLACQLPILLSDNKRWAELCAPTSSAIVVNFESPDVEATLLAMRKGSSDPLMAKNAHWDCEEAVLLTTIRSL